MVNYIYDGCDPTGDIEAEMKQSPVFSLIKELHFKYNMKVTGMDEVNYWRSGGKKASGYLMAKSNGMNVCRVYVEHDGKDIIYCYYSPYYEKERGSDSTDRKTLRSKKLSSLMATLKKNNVVPDDVTRVYSTNRAYVSAVRSIADKVGNDYRSTHFNSDQEYQLLKALLNNESLSDELLNKAKVALTNHDNVSDIKVKRDEEIKRFFGKSYVVLADGTDNIVTGIIKYNERDGDPCFDEVEPLRRCKASDIGEHFPDLAGYLAMLKVHVEDPRTPLVGNCLPRTTCFFSDLDIFTSMWDSPDHFKGVWMFTPCSTI